MRNCILFMALAAAVMASGQTQSSEQLNSPRLTRTFVHSAIQALADIHRWKEKARYDAENREPSPQFGRMLKVGARESLSQARLQATTDGDQKTAQELESLYAKVTTWTDELIAANDRLDASRKMSPDAIEKDEALLKINTCERAIHAVLLAQINSDQIACH